MSLNLVSRGDVQGIPLLEMSTADLLRPVTTGLTTNFITARAADGRAGQRRGPRPRQRLGNGSPMMGGTGPADAAIDGFIRNLAQEAGPSGVRALGLWVAGIPETFTPEKLSAVNSEMGLDDDRLPRLRPGRRDHRHLRQRDQHVPELGPV